MNYFFEIRKSQEPSPDLVLYKFYLFTHSRHSRLDQESILLYSQNDKFFYFATVSVSVPSVGIVSVVPKSTVGAISAHSFASNCCAVWNPNKEATILAGNLRI